MTFICILAFVVLAAVAAITRQRKLDPVGAGATITKIKSVAGVAVEVGSFVGRIAKVWDEKPATKPIGHRFGTRAALIEDDDDDE